MSSVDRDRSSKLLADLHGSTDEEERRILRDELVIMHLPLARHLARHFISTSQTHEDLVNVAVIGLIKAIEGFDLNRGTQLSTFAVPTMLGELRRHGRDNTWATHAPRQVKERAVQVHQATETLTEHLGRSPSLQEIAAHLDIEPSAALDGLHASRSYAAISLDAGDDSTRASSSDGSARNSGAEVFLASEDPGFGQIDTHHTVAALLRSLQQREREVLILRFWHGMTQSQIASRLGISQMHVSRLIRDTLAQLRSQVVPG